MSTSIRETCDAPLCPVAEEVALSIDELDDDDAGLVGAKRLRFTVIERALLVEPCEEDGCEGQMATPVKSSHTFCSLNCLLVWAEGQPAGSKRMIPAVQE